MRYFRRRTRGPNSKGPTLPKTSRFYRAAIGEPPPAWFHSMVVTKEAGVVYVTIDVKHFTNEVRHTIPRPPYKDVILKVRLTGGTVVMLHPSPATDSDDS